MLSTYEQERQDNISRNQAELVRLGLAKASPPKSVVATPVKKKRATRGKGKKIIVRHAVRQSDRLAILDRPDYVNMDGAAELDDDEYDSNPTSSKKRPQASSQHFFYDTHEDGSRKSGRKNLGKKPDVYVPDDPTPKRRRIVHHDASDELCFCGNGDEFGNGQYIECDQCKRWCHYECANIDEDDDVDNIAYTCHVCTGSSSDDSDSEYGSPSTSFHRPVHRRTLPVTIVTPKSVAHSIPSERIGSVETVFVPPAIPQIGLSVKPIPHVKLNLCAKNGEVSATLNVSAVTTTISIGAGSGTNAQEDAISALVTSKSVLDKYDGDELKIMEMIQMLDDRVTCPDLCSDPTNIRNNGGGTVGKYKYQCLNCGKRWQQNRPDKCIGLDLGITTRTYQKRRGFNTCSKCPGVPKRGHMCPFK